MGENQVCAGAFDNRSEGGVLGNAEKVQYETSSK